jgi:hypothetical protein
MKRTAAALPMRRRAAAQPARATTRRTIYPPNPGDPRTDRPSRHRSKLVGRFRLLAVINGRCRANHRTCSRPQKSRHDCVSRALGSTTLRSRGASRRSGFVGERGRCGSSPRTSTIGSPKPAQGGHPAVDLAPARRRWSLRSRPGAGAACNRCASCCCAPCWLAQSLPRLPSRLRRAPCALGGRSSARSC